MRRGTSATVLSWPASVLFIVGIVTIGSPELCPDLCPDLGFLVSPNNGSAQAQPERVNFVT